MIAQIVSDVATANWVIAISIFVVGVLLTRILNRIEKKLEEHDVRIANVEGDIKVINTLDGRD